ncbi:MAG: hypothetical protein P4M11_10555 [Candidatus Pacebacteria bacterium]|jgi:hypothetical protein|nr:hypothetical protein [Candidatus Paceibacterota bacterium]
MKKEKQKLQVGDVVKNGRNNFQRLIREVGYVEKDGNLEVRYSYSDEELNAQLMPTGKFKDEITGECSQKHLLNWQNEHN